MLELLNSGYPMEVFEAMETHRLEQLLREDAQSAEQGLDPQTLACITGILAKRKETPAPAWEEFQKHYLPDRTPPESTDRKRLFRRRIAAAAAAVLLLISIPPVSNANEYGSLRGYRSVWDMDNLWFEWDWGKWPDADKYRLEKFSLEDLQKMGCCPTWVPKGFEFSDRQDREVSGLESVSILLFNGDRDLVMGIHEVNGEKGGLWPVNGDSIQRYYYRGKTYYFFRNIDRYGACWIQDGLECYVTGMVSLREVRRMVHSLNN